MFRKVSGPVMQVFRNLGFDEKYAQELEIIDDVETNTARIAADVARLALVDLTYTFEDFKLQVTSEAVYKQQYVQGNFDQCASHIYKIYALERGDALTEKINHAPKDSEDFLKLNRELAQLLESGNKQSCAFAYREDEEFGGKLCAFELVYNIHNPEHWALQINRDIIAPLDKRTATLFLTDEGFCKKGVGDEVATESLHKEIETALKSRAVSKLITGLLDKDGKPCQKKLQELMNRLHNAQNLDNRDIKIRQVNAMIRLGNKWAENLPQQDDAFKLFILAFRCRSEIDVDFFKDEQYGKELTKLCEAIDMMFDHLSPETRTRAKYELELTKAAVELECYAQKVNLTDLEKEMLIKHAKKLLDRRENPASEIEKVVLDQLIQEAFQDASKELYAIRYQKCMDILETLRPHYNSESELAFIANFELMLREIERLNKDRLDQNSRMHINEILKLSLKILQNPKEEKVFNQLREIAVLMSLIWPEELSQIKSHLADVKNTTSLLNFETRLDALKKVIKETPSSRLEKDIVLRFCEKFERFYQANLSTLSNENQVDLINLLTTYEEWYVHCTTIHFTKSTDIRKLTMNAEDETVPEVRAWKQWSTKQQQLANSIMRHMSKIQQGNEIKTLNELTTELQRNISRLPQIKCLKEKIAVFRVCLENMLGESNVPDDVSFFEKGEKLIEDIENINYGNWASLSEDELIDLNHVLNRCITGISYLFDKKNIETNEEKIKENFAKLALLSQTISGHASPGWQKLGKGLLYFAGIALIAVGILAAIPSGGTSLLVAILGAVGISVSAAAGIGIGVGASVGTGLVGLSFFNANSISGLAKDASDFSTSLEAKMERDTAGPLNV